LLPAQAFQNPMAQNYQSVSDALNFADISADKSCRQASDLLGRRRMFVMRKPNSYGQKGTPSDSFRRRPQNFQIGVIQKTCGT